MKKFCLSFLSLLMCVMACQKENASEQAQDGERSVVYVSTENTKANFNGTRQVWEEGDRIVLFRVSDANGKALPEYFKYACEEGESAKFVAEKEDASGSPLSKVYALYPPLTRAVVNDDAESAYVNELVLPSAQDYKKDSFDPAWNYMTSVTEDENVVFSNAMGYLRIFLKGEDLTMSQILFTSVDKQALWYTDAKINLSASERVITSEGTSTTFSEDEKAMLTLNCNNVTLSEDEATSFIISLPAGTYENGFTVRFVTQGGSSAIKIGRTVINRSQILDLPVLNLGNLAGTQTLIKYKASQSLSTDGMFGDFLDVFDSANGEGKLLGSASIKSIVSDASRSDVKNGVYYLPVAGVDTVVELDFVATIDSIEGINNCENLLRVNAPSVREIGDNTFSGCHSLLYVALNNVESLGANAFSECSSLYSISGLSNVTSVGAYAFDGCSKLKDLEMGKDGAKITFAGSLGTTALTSVKINGDVVCGSAESIFGGSSLLETVTLGSASVSTETFKNCTSLKSFTTTGSASSTIADAAFKNMEKLADVSLSNASVGANAFEGCAALKSVVLSAGSIGAYAFYGCVNLESVFIDSCYKVGSHAFADLVSLTKLVLYVTEIDEYAFSGCTNAVLFKKDTDTTGEKDAFYFHDTVSIGNYAFAECTNLFGSFHFIVMPSVAPVGISAFYKVNLTSNAAGENGLYLKNVIMIGKSAFEGMSELKFVRLGSAIVNIGNKAFWGCAMSKDGVWTSDTEGPAKNDSGLFIDSKTAPDINFSGMLNDVFDNKVFLYCLEGASSAYSDWTKDSKIKVWAGLKSVDDYWK